jgi:hypothetical protein
MNRPDRRGQRRDGGPGRLDHEERLPVLGDLALPPVDRLDPGHDVDARREPGRDHRRRDLPGALDRRGHQARHAVRGFLDGARLGHHPI